MKCGHDQWATFKVRRNRWLLSVVMCAIGLCLTMGILPSGVVFAGDEEDRAEMQKKLNQGVMENPFSVEDTAKIDAYIKDAMQKDLKPKQEPPRSWRPGYTCANLHDYYEHRNCLYHYRYYGRYW